MKRRDSLKLFVLVALAASVGAKESLKPKAEDIARRALKESKEAKLEDLLQEAQELQAEGRRQKGNAAVTDMTSELHKLVSARLMLIRLEKDKESAGELPRYRKKVQDAELAFGRACAKVKD